MDNLVSEVALTLGLSVNIFTLDPFDISTLKWKRDIWFLVATSLHNLHKLLKFLSIFNEEYSASRSEIHLDFSIPKGIFVTSWQWQLAVMVPVSKQNHCRRKELCRKKNSFYSILKMFERDLCHKEKYPNKFSNVWNSKSYNNIIHALFFLCRKKWGR